MRGKSGGIKLPDVPHKRNFRIFFNSGRMHCWTVWQRNEHKHWEVAWFAYTEEEARRWVWLEHESDGR